MGITTIPKPKTTGGFARRQHVLLDDEWLLCCLEVWCAGLTIACKVFPSYAQLRAWLLTLLSWLGLEDQGYFLGGAQAGGVLAKFFAALSRAP